MRFYLNEFEFLRAANQISKRSGGTRLGNVGEVYYEKEYTRPDGTIRPAHVGTLSTYTNQHLIGVELLDEASSRFRGDVPHGHHEWRIRFGFCQSSITRAPNGGFPLYMDANILQFATHVDDVVDLFDCMLGKQDERMSKVQSWYQHCLAAAQRYYAELPQTHPLFSALNSIVHDDALVYAQEERTIG